MRQSRLMSLVEALTNVVVGYARRGAHPDAGVSDLRAYRFARGEPGSGRHPCWWRRQPAGDRGNTVRPWDADPPGRALACVHGHELARPARA